jgi:hypothetical protein
MADRHLAPDTPELRARSVTLVYAAAKLAEVVER